MLETVSVVVSPGTTLPFKATPGSSGYDLTARVSSPVELAPLERRVVPTGIHISLPIGYEAQVRPRSGLAAKRGISVLNSPGTIDADYTGEIGVILVNLSPTNVVVEPGERIAQLVFQRIEVPTLVSVEALSQTDRGSGGFGSTGTL